MFPATQSIPAPRPAARPDRSWARPPVTGGSPQSDVLQLPELRLDPAELAPNLTEILIRLARIRTDLSALTPLADRPIGDSIVHDLDEVIQRARLVVSGVANTQEPRPLTRPLTGPRGPSAHDAPLPSGPDYPAPTHR